eukprot:scaffold251358_cov22-Prasinocladus_malaysianus.AAC.2
MANCQTQHYFDEVFIHICQRIKAGPIMHLLSTSSNVMKLVVVSCMDLALACGVVLIEIVVTMAVVLIATVQQRL